MANSFSEPTWSSITPNTYASTSALEKGHASFVTISGMLVSLMQYHFSDGSNIENTKLKDLIWSEDLTSSQIYINMDYARDEKVASQKPGIYLRREDCETSTAGLLRGMAVQIDLTTVPNSNSRNTMMLFGKHTVISEAKTGTMSEMLAEEVWRRLLYFSKVIEDDCNLSYFNVGVVGKTQLKPDQPHQTYMTPIGLIWHKVYEWSVDDETVI